MIARLVRRFWPVQQDTTQTGEDWDRSYLAGNWDRILELDEVAHSAVVAGYWHAVSANRPANVLDIGCGEGALLKLLKIKESDAYLGVDISAVAIERASVQASGNIRFEVCDLRTGKVEGKFTAVILNECLYYFQDVEGLLSNLKGLLEEGGYVIVSIYIDRGTEKLWDVIDRVFETVDRVRATNTKGTAWNIAILRARG